MAYGRYWGSRSKFGILSCSNNRDNITTKGEQGPTGLRTEKQYCNSSSSKVDSGAVYG